MTERDRPTIRIHPGHVDLRILPVPGEHRGGERLVDLDHVEVGQRQARTLQDLGRRRDRSGEHQLRIGARDREVDEARSRPQAEAISHGVAHDQQPGGTVGDLGAVARRDPTVLLERRTERTELGQVGDANPFVGRHQLAVDVVQRHDLALEAAFRRGPSGPFVGCEGEGVELVARETPLLGDQLRRDALGYEPSDIGVPGRHPRPEREAILAVGHRRAHRYPGHRLHTGRNHDVVRTGHHALGGEVGGLLRRAALAVDRGAGYRFRPAGSEDRVAGHVGGLLPHLHDAAHDDIVNSCRIDPRSFLQRNEHLGREIDRVPVLQSSVSSAERRAYRFDDHGFGHGPCLPTTACASQRGRIASQDHAVELRGVSNRGSTDRRRGAGARPSRLTPVSPSRLGLRRRVSNADRRRRTPSSPRDIRGSERLSASRRPR